MTVGHQRDGRTGSSHWTLLFGLLVIVALAGVGWYLVRVMYSESLYTTRGTIAYALVIPQVIQGVPQLQPVEEPEFWHSAGDGPKPTQSQITYRSRASSAELRRALGEHFEGAGYESSERDDEDYVLGEYWIRIEIEPREADVNEIRVTRFF